MAGTVKNRVLTVVMDGVGESEQTFGNAVKLARTPWLDYLRQNALYTQLAAHGRAVGLPSDSDIGNSEVGHNALGAGQIFDQGAKLVQGAIDSGSLFQGEVWQKMVQHLKNHQSCLHFIGLLSDGNVHSHQDHLHSLIAAAKKAGIAKVRIHALLDGRDVGETSAERYVTKLDAHLASLRDKSFDVAVASGGGRMMTTMDRYQADWRIVERGWRAHVHGEADRRFSSFEAAIASFREERGLTDQNLPPFVIIDENATPVGKISDQDAVVFFNFRGDRAIEISQAFEEDNFVHFDRGKRPKVFYAGMMQYDGDLKIPHRYLVSPPKIAGTMGAYLANLGRKQFACSETQKYGHVTYFWNGNRSGKFSEGLENYVEVPSDVLSFDLKPWMKAYEITEETIAQMKRQSFDFGRINFANGDMVGHTGNFEAAVIAVATVDLMIGRLIQAAKQTNTILVVTADHGNCDVMFDVENPEDYPDWKTMAPDSLPKPKTAHTVNPVPFFIYDPKAPRRWKLQRESAAGLGNVAASCLTLMGEVVPSHMLPTVVVPS